MKKTTRKGFFFDIDETLTSEIDGRIPKSVLTAFKLIRDHGDLSFINTGRSFVSIADEIKSLKPDGFITGCGTSICDAAGRILWRFPVKDERSLLNAAAEKYQVDLLYEGREAISFSTYNHPITNGCQHLIDRYNRLIPDRIVSIHDADFEYDKYVCWCNDKQAHDAFADEVSESFDKIDRGLHWDTSFFEMVPKGCSKATGLQQVCTLEGIKLENTYGFGDSSNDLEMLRAVACAVVMGNSEVEELRKIASILTDKASEDGILKAVCKIYGIESCIMNGSS